MSAINDFKNDLKNKLSLKLSSIKSANFSIVEEREKTDLFLDYLSGQDTSVNKIIELYYSELKILYNIERTIPSIEDINLKSTWENALISEINAFPNNLNTEVDDTQTDIFNRNENIPEIGNTNSLWLNLNGILTENNYTKQLEDNSIDSTEIITEVGVDPNIEYYHYFKLETDIYDDTLSLLWKTRFIENAIKAIIDTRNFVENSTNFIDTDFDELNTIERNSYLVGIASYITDLGNYITLLENINNFDNSVLTIFNYTKEDLSSLISLLENNLGDDDDTEVDNTIYGYYNYFLSTSGNDVNYDSNLSSLETLINDIFTEMQDRETEINSFIGSDYTTNNSLLKIRYLILDALTGESQSPLFSWNALTSQIRRLLS